MMYRIHNLSPEDLLKSDLVDDENFIHVSTVTKEMLLETEKIILYSKKTLMKVEDQIKIVNFEKSSLIHELNKKYKEYFPGTIITVTMSKQEEDNFAFKTLENVNALLLLDESRLKLTIKNNSLELNTIDNRLCYNQPELCLSRFLTDKLNLKALQIEMKNNQFNLLSAQIIQFNREKDMLENMTKISPK